MVLNGEALFNKIISKLSSSGEELQTAIDAILNPKPNKHPAPACIMGGSTV